MKRHALMILTLFFAQGAFLGLNAQSENPQPKVGGTPLTAHVSWTLKTQLNSRVWFNHDGTQIAVGGTGGGAGRAIRIIDRADGKERAVFKAADQEIRTLVFHPKGEHIVYNPFSTSEIRFLECKGGKEKLKLIPHSSAVVDFAIHPNGLTIATCGSEKDPLTGSVKLWDAETGELKRTIPIAVRNPISSVAFSWDGKLLAYCVPRREINTVGDLVLWDLEKNKEVRTIKGAFSTAVSTTWIWFNAESTRIVTADIRHAHVWRAENGELVRRIPITDAAVKTTTLRRSYSPIADLLVTSYNKGNGSKTVVISPNHPETCLTLDGEFGFPAISHDGRWLALVQADSMRVWELKLGKAKGLEEKK